MTKPLKNLIQIPKPNGSVPNRTPELAFEAPHAKIARLNREMVETTDAIQTLKKEFANLNIRAQTTRQAIPTDQITHHKNAHRELASHLLALQTELASVNRDLRARKAERMGNGRNGKDVPVHSTESNGAGRGTPKKTPLLQHPEFPVYFHLAAKNELATGLYDQVIRTAKSLLQSALDMGVE